MNKKIILCALLLTTVYAFTYVKRWDGGDLVTGAQNDQNLENAFYKLQAYNVCEDIVVDKSRKFDGTFDSIRFKMERGKWYGDYTQPPCGGTASTVTARSETYSLRNQSNEALLGFAFRYDPNSDVRNDCPIVIFQRHIGNSGAGGPPLTLTLRGNEYWVYITHGSGQENRIKQGIAPATPRVWDSLVLWYKTTARNDGFVRIWVNDTLVFEYEGKTNFDGVAEDDAGYFKFGFYMANLKTGSCDSPAALNVWAANYARISYAPLQKDIAYSYEYVSPNRRRAITGIDYPTDVEPEPSATETVNEAAKIGHTVFVLMASLATLLLVC